MRTDPLTSDNPFLSEVRFSFEGGGQQLDFASGPVPQAVLSFVRLSLTASTRKAYASDLAHFKAYGGFLPSTDVLLASYIAEYASRLSVASLARRIASISTAHEARGMHNPARSELVRATIRGIKRSRGSARREAKALLREDLFQVLDHMGNRLKDARDRALLLIGFAGGFRRSELTGLDVCDVEQVRQGLVVHLRRSKTDQEGTGRKIGIPHGRTRFCPVEALSSWLRLSAIVEGPVFRPVDRHARVGCKRLTGDAVSSIVKTRVSQAGFDAAGYSGHSLRAGFATSAARSGASSSKIKQQTGHASDAMLARYVRDGELFVANAAGDLL